MPAVAFGLVTLEEIICFYACRELVSGGNSSADNTLDSLDHLFRLDNGGSLKLIRICCGDVL